MPFRNREDAGERLAHLLENIPIKDPLVIALPRGGVPVAAVIAEHVKAPLDVLAVRKIGAPENPEFGIGAITEEGFHFINPASVQGLGLSDEQVQYALEQELIKVEHQIERFRGGRSLSALHGKAVILVDDGLATGSTATVACQYLRKRGATKVILAVPVCARDSISALKQYADDVICLECPDQFYAVGLWYEDFTPVLDEEVLALMERFGPRAEQPPLRENAIQVTPGLGFSSEVDVSDGRRHLPGHLTLPSDCCGVVLFAHGSGSSRFSPRNQEVAQSLNQAGIGTLLFDLLTLEESESRQNVFDIPLLASRLTMATHWLRSQDNLHQLPIGYFGASTGGAAALWAAAELKGQISAVVSRGGRPDLAEGRLAEVSSPTLLIVGGDDEPVLSWNREVLPRLLAGKLAVIPGATHLFEEPGALQAVADEARDWFLLCFEKPRKRRPHDRKVA